MTVVADLHVHTTASDGRLSLPEVCRRARQAGLAAIAITDHDRVHPDLGQPISTRDGLTIIRGLEMKVTRQNGDHIDLLAYGVETTDGLDALIEGLQRDRRKRARRIVARICDHLEIDLDIEITDGIGRPHIARAVAEHPDTAMSVQDVFDELIGNGRPCHVSRDVPDGTDAIPILQEVAPIVAVAHPLRYEDVDGALEVAATLGAVERWYPYDHDPDESPVTEAIETHDLVATGGSDAHDGNVGVTGLDYAAFTPIRRILEIE